MSRVMNGRERADLNTRRQVGLANPRIEFFRIALPLDKIFFDAFALSRRQNFFNFENVVSFNDSLNFLFVKAALNFLVSIIFQFVCPRLRIDNFCYSEYFFCPIRLVTFVESSSRFTYPNFVTDFEFCRRLIDHFFAIHSFSD